MDLAWSRGIVVALLLVGCGPVVSDADGGGSSGAADTEATASGGADGSTSESPSASTSSASAATTADPTADATQGPTTSSASSTSDTFEGSTGAETGSTGGPGVESLCPDDRQWALSASGTNLGVHEGRRVWISAVEPVRDTDEVVVRMEAVVSAGAFDLSCPQGLSTNNWYPSIAVVIDADDDGTCSEGDVAFTMQLFAWMSDQGYLFDGDEAYSLETDPPWMISGDAWQPVAEIGEVWGVPFCDYYLAPTG